MSIFSKAPPKNKVTLRNLRVKFLIRDSLKRTNSGETIRYEIPKKENLES